MYVGSRASVTISGGTITGNSGRYGGGVYRTGTGTVNYTGGSISGNTVRNSNNYSQNTCGMGDVTLSCEYNYSTYTVTAYYLDEWKIINDSYWDTQIGDLNNATHTITGLSTADDDIPEFTSDTITEDMLSYSTLYIVFERNQQDGYVNLANSSLTLTYPNSSTNQIISNHGGTLSVSSSDTSIATVSLSGTTLTITPVNASTSTVTITVICAETDDYTEASATFTVTVNKGTLSGSVSIGGSAIYNSTLTAFVNNKNYASVSYQWYSNSTNSTSGGTAISGATSSTYQIGSGMVGKYIYVVVTMTKTNYNMLTVRDATFSAVAKADITPTVDMTGYVYGETKSSPSISGNSGNGTVTYYYNTTNSNSNGTLWSTVTGSTSLNAGTYYMYAVVEETTDYNGATTATKSFTVYKGTLYGGSVIILGSAIYNSTLTANVTNTNNASLAYQWYSNSTNSTSGGTAISGATSSTYQIGSGMAGKYIYVVVTMTKTNYNTKTVSAVTSSTVTKITLTTPTGLTWSDSLGTASWNLVSSIGNVTVTYTVTLYKDSLAVNTQTGLTATSYDFSSVMETQTSGGAYTFKVQAISSDTDNCNNSALSSESAVLQIRQITVNIEGSVATAGLLVDNVENAITASGTKVIVKETSELCAYGTAGNNQIIVMYVRVGDSDIPQVSATREITTSNSSAMSWYNGDDTTIKFVFKEAYELSVTVDGSDATDGVVVTTDDDISKKAGDYIATDATVTLTVNETTLAGADSNKVFMGFSYEKDGEKYTTYNQGNSDFTITNNEGTYTCVTEEQVSNVKVFIKQIIANVTVNASSMSSEVLIKNEEGFVMTITADGTTTLSLFEGVWTVVSGTVTDPTNLFTVSATYGTISYATVDGNHQYTFTPPTT